MKKVLTMIIAGAMLTGAASASSVRDAKSGSVSSAVATFVAPDEFYVLGYGVQAKTTLRATEGVYDFKVINKGNQVNEGKWGFGILKNDRVEVNGSTITVAERNTKLATANDTQKIHVTAAPNTKFEVTYNENDEVIMDAVGLEPLTVGATSSLLTLVATSSNFNVTPGSYAIDAQAYHYTN